MSRREMKARVFIDFALQLRAFSPCKKRSVACIIFDDRYQRIEAIGYNGPPVGEDHSYCLGDVPKCGCLHAEVNALLKLRAENTSMLHLFSTLAPCITCAGYIVNRDIRTVIYAETLANRQGIARLKRSGVRVFSKEQYYATL